MAEIDTKRIINLPDQSGYNSGDYVAIDNATNGTHRFPVASMVATAGQTVAPEYDATSTYAVGDFVIYDGLLYCCSTAIETAEAWTAAHWTQTNVGDEIAELKNDLTQFPNGTYPNMSVGNADQLTATVGIEDNAPYLFRTSGGSVDIGDREDVRKIVGGTIVNNQQVKPLTTSDYSFNNAQGTIENGVATFTATAQYGGIAKAYSYAGSVVANHVYIRCFDVRKNEEANGGMLYWPVHFLNPDLNVYFSSLTLNVWTTVSAITRASGNRTEQFQASIYDNRQSGWTSVSVKNIYAVDLTQDYGSTIADYIYSLETATAGAGVAWLKKHFPAQFDAGYQAYDAGSLQSVSGLTAHKTVGFNQWDGQWEVGALVWNTGENVGSTTRIRSKDYIPCIPSTTYYGKIPSGVGMNMFFYDYNKNFISYTSSSVSNGIFETVKGAWYMRFFTSNDSYGTTYKNDICINLHWDGEKDGTYEPYKEYTYALDDSLTLRGIPKLDANNQLYYDGDEYLPDGTVNRRYGIVDLGTLTWTKESGHFYSEQVSGFKIISAGTQPDFVCAKYISASYVTVVADSTDKVIGMSNTPRIYVYDSSYTDAATFKTAMSGVYLVYELETPTTETADPYQETQIVDDFGTEEFILADGAFPVPVGHNTMYQNNLRAKLEMSPDSPDGDGLYVVQQESGQNEYVPLASTSTIQDILTRLTALENENT